MLRIKVARMLKSRAIFLLCAILGIQMVSSAKVPKTPKEAKSAKAKGKSMGKGKSAATLIPTSLPSMAPSPAPLDTLYAVTDASTSSADASVFGTFDPAANHFEPIAIIDLALEGLTYDASTQTMYGVTSNVSMTTSGATAVEPQLITINIKNGATTIVGSTGFSASIEALMTNNVGVLIGVLRTGEEHPPFVVINKDNGTAVIQDFVVDVIPEPNTYSLQQFTTGKYFLFSGNLLWTEFDPTRSFTGGFTAVAIFIVQIMSLVSLQCTSANGKLKPGTNDIYMWCSTESSAIHWGVAANIDQSEAYGTFELKDMFFAANLIQVMAWGPQR